MIKSFVEQFTQRLQAYFRLQDLDSLHRHRRAGIDAAAEPTRFHLLERGLLRQRTFQLAEVSGTKWWDALRVQVESWAPFPQTNYVVLRQQHRAVVWAWDEQAFQERCDALNIRRRHLLVIPESMLFAPLADGVQLCACSEGFEAQYWSAGVLQASRYWASMPDQAAWINFQRGVKLPLALQQPELPDVASLPAPNRLPETLPRMFNPNSSQGLQQFSKPWAAVVGVFLMVLLTSLSLVDLYRYDQALDELHAQRVQLEREAAPVLSALDHMMNNKERIEAIQDVMVRPEPLEVMAHLGQQLEGSGARVRRIEWSNRQLRIALDVPQGGQRAELIRLLEASPWLTEVREMSDSQAFDIQLQARVLPLTAVGPLAVELPTQSQDFEGGR